MTGARSMPRATRHEPRAQPMGVHEARDPQPWQCDVAGSDSDLASLQATPVSLQRIASPSDEDFAALAALLCRNQRYWHETQASPMTPAAAADLLRVLPPGSSPAHKYLWALRQNGRLVGVLDAVSRWPGRDTLTIGLLMIDERHQRCGLGRAALAELARRCRGWAGLRRWRIAVVGSQSGALSFWRDAGFFDTGQRHVATDQRAAQVVMEKPLAR